MSKVLIIAAASLFFASPAFAELALTQDTPPRSEAARPKAVEEGRTLSDYNIQKE